MNIGALGEMAVRSLPMGSAALAPVLSAIERAVEASIGSDNAWGSIGAIARHSHLLRPGPANVGRRIRAGYQELARLCRSATTAAQYKEIRTLQQALANYVMSQANLATVGLAAAHSANNRISYADLPSAEAFVDGHPGEGKIHWTDVAQGDVGDCYFLAMLAGLAGQDPARIRQVLKPHPQLWRYHRVVFADGSYEDIDMRVPVFRGTERPAYAQWGDQKNGRREIWPLLLEKAWAQRNGGYQRIRGSIRGCHAAASAWRALFGGKAQTYVIDSTQEKRNHFVAARYDTQKGHYRLTNRNLDAMWQLMQTKHHSGSVCVLGSLKPQDLQRSTFTNGQKTRYARLRTGGGAHAYALLTIGDSAMLYNPHGFPVRIKKEDLALFFFLHVLG